MFRQIILTAPGRLPSPAAYLLLLILGLCGCASSHSTTTARSFNFQTDTFSYANELVWDYHFDDKGKWTGEPRVPKPDYTHHCFVVARAARQFFDHARFDASQPIADTSTYRRLIRNVIGRSPRRISPDDERVVIPGYANLHAFSEAQEALLKAQCGGAWRSYVQRGHWRMLFPFSRKHQQNEANDLLAELARKRPPIIHIVTFPSRTINHALVLLDAVETEKEIRFSAYDPNDPKVPVPLTFDRATRTFHYPQTSYFPGGRAEVYEVYCDWLR